MEFTRNFDIKLIQSQLKRFTKDTKFLESIRPELTNKYPDQWIAVYQKEVVAVDKSLKRLIDHLKDTNIPASDTVVELLRTKRIPMIL